tara:strand:- start:3203 stop:4780 length:1578 start_codon:yes stop_codon:yes gene_type:complete
MWQLRKYIRNLLFENLSDATIPPPPKESIEELSSVINQYYDRVNDDSVQYDLDERMELLFNEVVEKNSGENVVEYVKELKTHPLEIVSALKEYFARKRPEDVAADFGIDWKSDSVDMKTINNSYSYPSGHTAQSYYVALKLCDRYPQLRNELFEVAEAVAQSRIDRGVHFPSDLDAGRIVANQLYQQNKTSTPVILEGMVSPNSVSGKYAIWADISADQAGNLDEDLTSIDFLMYDWSAAVKHIEDELKEATADGRPGALEMVRDYGILEAITDSAVACMRVRPYGDYEGCNSAWEVIRSAADGGLGPTMYDLIMSIAPNGLFADRSEVSPAAQSVYHFYANRRTSVDKDFLDPGGFTDTEYDDCRTYGRRADPLRYATRMMAMDYFDTEWPDEHTQFKDNADLSVLEQAGSGDADTYFRVVSEWIIDNVDPDWDEDTWYEWKVDGELDLMRYWKSGPDPTFEDPDYLNLSYNTNYAVSSFEEMEENHMAFINEISDMIPGSEERFYEDPEALHFAVRDFFRERV